MNQVAKGIADKTEGITEKQLYTAIRKRASRERWPLPDAIIRRAKAQALVAAGVAGDAKQGTKWRKGESALHSVAQSREAVGMGVPRSLEEHERELVSRNAPEGAGDALCVAESGGGEALQTAPPTAAELVTQSLATRGQTGLSLALDAALASLNALDPATPVPIRSMQDLLTAVKATQAAAGLDKPGVAVQVNLNNGINSSITAWESVESYSS